MSLYDLTKQKVKDTSGKLDDPTDFENNIAAAIYKYSEDRPRLVCSDIPGEDGPDIALPADWAAGLSSISAIEYPIGTVPESLLDSRDWRFYRTPTDTFIRFAAVSPASSAEVRLLYNALHTELTIPASDLDAVADLAAAKCFLQLAAAFGQTGDPTIAADSVNYRTKTGEFTALAKKSESLYKNHLGIKEGDTTGAAMATAPPPDSRRPRLTHGRA